MPQEERSIHVFRLAHLSQPLIIELATPDKDVLWQEFNTDSGPTIHPHLPLIFLMLHADYVG